jgi:hypothetical protein
MTRGNRKVDRLTRCAPMHVGITWAKHKGRRPRRRHKRSCVMIEGLVASDSELTGLSVPQIAYFHLGVQSHGVVKRI